MKVGKTSLLCWLVLLASVTLAQAPAAPVAYSSIAELNQMLSSLQQTTQSMQEDLSHLRVEKWKTDSNTKKQTQGNVESILRNVQNALPAILTDLKNAPESGPLTFKLYRNLDALYDVMSSTVELAGAFGGKDDFQSLSRDMEGLDGSRRAFADRMDKLANAKETEIGQLRTALQAARAEAAPKKVVVDDTAPPAKKTQVPKKRTTTKPKTASPPAAEQPAAPPSQ
jgi:hypothetical protein